MFATFVLAVLQIGQPMPDQQPYEVSVGDALARISCPPDYQAFVFATGLSSPDGMCFGPKGALYVVEETLGQVTQITQAGDHIPLAKSLRSPEGIDFGASGVFYVTEDLADGRLLSITPKGEVTVLLEGLDAPEGVIQVGNKLFFTESSAQLSKDTLKFKSRLSFLAKKNEAWGQPKVCLEVSSLLSFSEIVSDGECGIILANESAGGFLRKSLLRFNLQTTKLTSFSHGLDAPEGLAMTRGESGPFPLWVAEEEVARKGRGRITQVDSNGKATLFATGFYLIEDVLVASDGTVYVSEDSTGLIIAMRRRPQNSKDVEVR